uniref:SGL domain-containing protein n=1 Tax=Heterorhabditis bacteriophora TaxID=37862 RepID=A0A1I7XSD8_HETBA
MVETLSDTSDQQRFDEMWLHLTPRGATVPYNVCFDPEGNVWVATKGGLFKFDGERRTTLWERKNMFPKKMAAFPQVVCYRNTIIYTCAEEQDKTTELRFFSLNGDTLREHFIDGLIISLVVSNSGEIFISKQPVGPESTIFKQNGYLVVMDKSGRFLRFSQEGDFIDQLAEIDAYLANGFCIKGNAALMALSGVVLDQDKRTICDDWLEWINLDGSSWKKPRENKKTHT